MFEKYKIVRMCSSARMKVERSTEFMLILQLKTIETWINNIKSEVNLKSRVQCKFT